MKNSGLYLLAFTIIGLTMAVPVSAHAGCTKWCKAFTYPNLTIGMKDKSTKKRVLYREETFQADGKYGGGCRTSVGRQKARKRGCAAVRKLVKNNYQGKPRAIQSRICSRVSNGILKTKRENNQVFYTDNIPIKDIKWIKVDYIKVTLWAEDAGFQKRLTDPFRIKGSPERFTCVNGKPVSAQPPPPKVTHRIEKNTNRPGKDYKKFSLGKGKTGYRSCMHACLKDSRCRAWTYKKPIGKSKAICWLKDAVPKAKTNNKFISGVK